jgi:hypothetical protein
MDWFLGDEGRPGVLQQCMTHLVPIYSCDHEGRRRPGTPAYYMGTEMSVMSHWGVKLGREAGLEMGVPEGFLLKN